MIRMQKMFRDGECVMPLSILWKNSMKLLRMTGTFELEVHEQPLNHRKHRLSGRRVFHERLAHSASKRARSKNDFCVPMPVVDSPA